MATVGGLVVATAYVLVRATRAATRADPLDLAAGESTCGRTAEAIGGPLLLAAVVAVVATLVAAAV